jgi:hypothetical protein
VTMTPSRVAAMRPPQTMIGTNSGAISPSLYLGQPNTGDELRRSIACAGFVCFIPLFDGLVAHAARWLG